MAEIYQNILETIGGTPIVRLKNVIPKNTIHQYFVKLEYFNPGLSVKDRIALALIEGAERDGKLKPGGTIIEATSGNTGMGLAMVAAVKGYKSIFVMPDKISEEKRAILRAYGSKVVITPTAVEPEDARSYISVALKLAEITPNSFLTNQYHNPDNPKQHIKTTGPEIWDQMGGDIDVFVAGAGTGGTISGVGKYLKSKKSDIQIVCSDPVGSILYDLFYHKKVIDPPKSYKVEGVGEDMLPDNVHLNVIDGFVKVNDQDSFDMTKRLVAEEGMCVGPSSAMALVGAVRYSEEHYKTPKKILVMMPDSGRSYLSKAFNDQWLKENGFLKTSLMTTSVRQGVEMLKIKTPTFDLKSSIKEVAQTFAEKGITEGIVLSGGKYLGVVEEKDLLMQLALGKVKPEETLIHVTHDRVSRVNQDATLQQLSDRLDSEATVLFEEGEKRELINRRHMLKLMTQMEA